MKLLSYGILTIMFFAMFSCVGSKSKEYGERLPRTEKNLQELNDSMGAFFSEAQQEKLDIHSIMILKNGNVVYEKWTEGHVPTESHVLNSVSKTFTSLAIGMAIDEGKLKLTDKLVSLFPEFLPDSVSDNLAAITVRDLLTMTCGHDVDHTYEMQRMDSTINWVAQFLSYPVEHKPGIYFCYNSVGTFMLSAIIQKVTGSNLLDFLRPRLFEPLHIKADRWDKNPQGIEYGGWGLFLATEDLAKMGQLLLQKGQWNGKQLVSEEWVTELSKVQVASRQAGMTEKQVAAAGMTKENSDWLQGYGYQTWRCRNNAFRADGYRGQYILVFPELQSVVAITADIEDMQKELNLVWNHIYPVLKNVH